MTTISPTSAKDLFKEINLDGAVIEGLLDLLPEANILVNQRGEIQFGNAAAVEMSGYTRKELSRLSLSTLIPQVESLKQLASGEKLQDALTLITRRSQSLGVNAQVNALSNSGGLAAVKLKKASLVAREIGESSREEARWKAMDVLLLAGQQKDLASTYRQILQAGHLLTGAQHLAIYSQKDGAALGLSAVHGSGLEFPASLSETDLLALREPMIWRPGRSVRSELHHLANRKKLPYLASNPLDLTHIEEGMLVCADGEKSAPDDLLILMQVLAASASTSRIQMELLEKMEQQVGMLAKNADLSRKLEKHVQDGIIYLDADLNVHGINLAAQSMLGYSEAEALGRSANNILISSHPLLNHLVRAQAGDEVEGIGDIKLHRRDGSDLLANIRVQRIEDEEEKAQIVVFMSDLSENEALHVQSQQLQQRAWLGEVTAIFAHEVRNPINNISTGLQLMQMNFEADDPLQEQIAALQEDCDRLEHRMKSVLSFSRSMKHNPAPIDLGTFCEEQIMRWKPKMASRQIEGHLTVESENSMIMGDRQALDQVFTNLINNSIQALEDNDSGIIAIKIKASLDENGKEEVILHFSDNGPGIPDDLAKRVFDPFFTTKASEGTGLGLAITKRIIQAHKGDIKLESFPGGTLFKMHFPSIQRLKESAE